ncbi:hypothetical protein QFC19_002286 [Naganishia cerealis]|uniref:Uncharacterized protein n=1 Tax=Naganishia cerealis TaxID=610337 RepID=A0ACC2WBT9_9TREE|nr:hypothetical protein QFC19_002286 [Naganishia cerealis]
MESAREQPQTGESTEASSRKSTPQDMAIPHPVPTSSSPTHFEDYPASSQSPQMSSPSSSDHNTWGADSIAHIGVDTPAPSDLSGILAEKPSHESAYSQPVGHHRGVSGTTTPNSALSMASSSELFHAMTLKVHGKDAEALTRARQVFSPTVAASPLPIGTPVTLNDEGGLDNAHLAPAPLLAPIPSSPPTGPTFKSRMPVNLALRSTSQNGSPLSRDTPLPARRSPLRQSATFKQEQVKSLDPFRERREEVEMLASPGTVDAAITGSRALPTGIDPLNLATSYPHHLTSDFAAQRNLEDTPGSFASSSQHASPKPSRNNSSSGALDRQASTTQKADYVIAVVGAEQVGKTTMIGKAFKAWGLSEPMALLTEDSELTPRISRYVTAVDTGKPPRKRLVEILEIDIRAVRRLDSPSAAPSIWPAILPRIDGVMVCYDASNVDSLIGLPEVVRDLCHHLPAMVIACKSDPEPLVELAIKPIEGNEIGAPYGIGLVELSVLGQQGRHKMRMSFGWMLKAISKQRRPAGEALSDASGTISKHRRAPSSSSRFVSLEDLLDRLSSSILGGTDNAFVNTFFLSYRRFCEPPQILSYLLDKWFEITESKGMVRQYLQWCQIRMVITMAEWLETYPGDFASPEAKKLIMRFYASASQLAHLAHIAADVAIALQSIRNVSDLDLSWSIEGIRAKRRTTMDMLSISRRSSGSQAVDSEVPTIPRQGSDVQSSYSDLDETTLEAIRASQKLQGSAETFANADHSNNPESSAEDSNKNPDHWNESKYSLVSPVEIGWSDMNIVNDGTRSRTNTIVTNQSLHRIDTNASRQTRPSSAASRSISEIDSLEGKIFQKPLTLFYELSDLALAIELCRDEWQLYSAIRVYEKFCSILTQLIRLRNYSTCWAVTSGLNDLAIRRLGTTLSIVRASAKRELQDAMRLIDPTGSYKVYREFLKRDCDLGSKAIPFLGVITQDLTKIHAAHSQDQDNQEQIHWSKYSVMAEAIAPLALYQARGHIVAGLPQSGGAQSLILDTPRLDEDGLYRRSKHLEPDTRPGMPTAQSSASSSTGVRFKRLMAETMFGNETYTTLPIPSRELDVDSR